MTLAASGAIGIGTGVAGRDIALEFGLAANAVFPTAFYGKGGAPASGALSFADFYGRSNTHSPVVSPDPTEGSGSTTIITTATASCAVSGGVGPFSYSWVRTGGDTNITALAPTSASTSFQAVAMGPGTTRTATFRCDVTDTGNGNLVVQSNVITVNVERF